MSVDNQGQQSIDYSNTKLQRGPTPPNIEETCLQLCQQYLGGVWVTLTIDEIKVERLSGGLTNQMYYCAIDDNKQRCDAEEPQEVAILLYGHKFFNNSTNESNKRLTDTIIALQMSEKGLGPKVYGLFERGQILKYYKRFEINEQNDPKLVDELARRLARIHAMDVPIKKTGNWLFDFYDHNYKLANDRFNLKQLIEDSKCQTLKTYDIGQELEWLKKSLIQLESPHLFSHVDFRSSNVMITESDGMILCDFEYSCYGYRGFDFGSMFYEWGQVWGKWSASQDFATDDTIKPFIDSYIEESVKLKGKQFSENRSNSFENILKEVKLFSLAACMWTVVFHLPMNESIITEIPFNKIESMKRIETHYTIYQKCKHLFIAQNDFNKELKDSHKKN